MEPRLGARAASAVAAVADVDAEAVVAIVVRAQRGGEARGADHAERVPAAAAGVALRRAGFRFGADDDLVALAAVVRAAAVVAEGGGAGHAEAVLLAAGGEVLREEPVDPPAAGLRACVESSIYAPPTGRVSAPSRNRRARSYKGTTRGSEKNHSPR